MHQETSQELSEVSKIPVKSEENETKGGKVTGLLPVSLSVRTRPCFVW